MPDTSRTRSTEHDTSQLSRLWFSLTSHHQHLAQKRIRAEDKRRELRDHQDAVKEETQKFADVIHGLQANGSAVLNGLLTKSFRVKQVIERLEVAEDEYDKIDEEIVQEEHVVSGILSQLSRAMGRGADRLPDFVLGQRRLWDEESIMDRDADATTQSHSQLFEPDEEVRAFQRLADEVSTLEDQMHKMRKENGCCRPRVSEMVPSCSRKAEQGTLCAHAVTHAELLQEWISKSDRLQLQQSRCPEYDDSPNEVVSETFVRINNSLGCTRAEHTFASFDAKAVLALQHETPCPQDIGRKVGAQISYNKGGSAEHASLPWDVDYNAPQSKVTYETISKDPELSAFDPFDFTNQWLLHRLINSSKEQRNYLSWLAHANSKRLSHHSL